MSTLNFSFSVISDVHITENNKKSHEKLERTLNDLKEVTGEDSVIIMNGDLTNDGRSKSYAKLGGILNNYKRENMFFTIGNHEFFKKDGNTNSIQRFLDFAGLNHVYYEKEMNGHPFIFLGTENWGSEIPLQKDSAVLSDEQLSWLKDVLSEKEKLNLPIFVFLHQPIPNTLTGTDLPYYKNSIIQAKELTNILRKYNHVFYFSGHSHWDLRMPHMLQRKPFVIANTGSVYNTYGPDGQGHEIITDPDGSQGLIVDVYDSKVMIRGRDFYRKQWIDEFNYTIDL